MHIKTMKIKHDDGYAVINVDDFDKSIHKAFGGDQSAPSAPQKLQADADPTDWGTDSGDQFSDEQLRDAIKIATGKAPGGRSSRETLIQQFNDLNARSAS